MIFRYIFGLLIVVLLGIIYYKYNPEVYHLFPSCPMHQYLGIDCPGCGSQRAVHALLHGNLLNAIDLNLLLVLSLPFLVIHFIYKTYGMITRRQIRWKLWYHPQTPKIIFMIVISFWVLRNIPIYPFSYLAP